MGIPGAAGSPRCAVQSWGSPRLLCLSLIQERVLQLRQHFSVLVSLASLKGSCSFTHLVVDSPLQEVCGRCLLFDVRSLVFPAISQLCTLPQNNALEKYCGSSGFCFYGEWFCGAAAGFIGEWRQEKKYNCCTVSCVLLTEVCACVLWLTDWKIYFITEVKILFFPEFHLFLHHKILAFV